MSIGKAVIVARRNLGFSREALAERAEIAYDVLLGIEADTRVPSPQCLESIAKAVGLTTRHLFLLTACIAHGDDELMRDLKELLLIAQPILM